jgi:hypothetical protein
MKTNMLATSLLLSLGLSVASAGQPDTRFYGKWVGAETYEVPRAVTRYGYRRNEPPIKKSAVVVVGNSGQTLSFEEGLLQGRVEISPLWGENTLDFKVRTKPSLRTGGKLVLSADGNTLTESAVALLPGRPEGRELNAAVTCNISGTFHRQGKK